MQAYRNLGLTTVLLCTLIVLDAVNQLLVLVIAKLAPEFFASSITPIAKLVDGAAVVISLSTTLLFGYWIYAAGRNVRDAGVEDLEFTPGSRIWWFLVPFANLVKPFQGMRELWNASHGELHLQNNQNIVSLWWALWLANSVTSYFSVIFFRGNMATTTPIWVMSIMGLPLAAVAILLVRAIHLAQLRVAPSELSEVFA